MRKYNFNKVVFLFIIFSYYPILSYSQDIEKFNKDCDSLVISVIGKLDSSQVKIKNHYILLKDKKNEKIDTLWTSNSGPFANDYLNVYDVYLSKNYCSILYSNQLAMYVVINKINQHGKWRVISKNWLPLRGKEMSIKKIYFFDEKTVKTEFNSKKDLELFEIDSGKVIKYLETKDGNQTKRLKVKIKESEKYFIELGN